VNLYFLVEGVTERKLYPSWLRQLLPNFQRVNSYNQVTQKTYYLISGGGYPGLLDSTLPNAIGEVVDSGKYNYLVVVLNADEVTALERRNEVEDRLRPYDLGQCQAYVVVQNHCLESWLLSNRIVYSRRPTELDLRNCIVFYDVFNDDPELMAKPSEFLGSIAQYHYHYLQAMLRARQIRYTKNNPRDTAEPYYLQQLQDRVAHTPTHLHTFQAFLAFCDQVRQEATTD
jgi:hypothetical protein